MRRLTTALFFLFILAPAFAQEQDTAYEALRVIGQLDPAYLNRVVAVTGVDGDPQPTKWNILIADRGAPGGVREVQVRKGRIISNQTPRQAVTGSTRNALITSARLNLDSSGAFSVASYTADKSHVNFSLASYTLRTNDRGQPVWIVTLQDEVRRPLGTIHINAQKGNVTRVEGMYRGANMAHVEEDRGDRVRSGDQYAGNEEIEEEGESDYEGEEDENIVKRQIKRMFYRTKSDAQRIFQRVRHSFADFIAGDR